MLLTAQNIMIFLVLSFPDNATETCQYRRVRVRSPGKGATKGCIIKWNLITSRILITSRAGWNPMTKAVKKLMKDSPRAGLLLKQGKGKHSNSKETLRKNVYKKMEELLLEVMKNRNSFKQLFSCWKRERWILLEQTPIGNNNSLCLWKMYPLRF